MTLQELGEIHDEVLTPEQVAPIVKLNPHSIRIAARENPAGLGFPVIRAGTRVKIPRLAFLEYMGYKPDTRHA